MSVSAPTSAPTTAERIRSACVRADGAMLAVAGGDPTPTPVHHLLDDGSFVVAAPDDGAPGTVLSAIACAGAAGVPAVLEMTDYAPLALREPVRALVWIRGRLRQVPAGELPALLDRVASTDPNPALLQVNSDNSGIGPGSGRDVRLAILRLQIESVVVADATGAESVPPAALLTARPDPFCAMESCWLQHLEAAHHDVVDRLAARLPSTLRRGRVRPLGLDRYGVRLRVESADGDHDVRLPFTRPVDDVTALSQAIRVLMGCPFLNGLRARGA
ncbi:DUF2470 domain-containing protein [Mycolicibacterium poriferae]|uniref:DUF2470 domain-containing protein n=1 Tax=Mycolicibacterium poriferae TaxID=39694 RepID=UPI0024BB9EE8|nr:DUF2470 domain-containing protein [Mycolicibacterium poriferae]